LPLKTNLFIEVMYYDREVDRGTVNDFLTGGYYKRAARFVGERREKNIGKSV